MRNQFVFALVLFSSMAFAQVAPSTNTSTDVFVMGGSDFVRPGLLPRVNLNIGVGHTEKFLSKNPFGDELTFSYTYENGGNHGFFHTKYGAHTENVGLMKNFNLLKHVIVKPGGEFDKVTFYTWPLIGITTLTGGPALDNHLYLGAAFGSAIHFTPHHAVWVQEMWNKVLSLPGYPTTSVGYTYSF